MINYSIIVIFSGLDMILNLTWEMLMLLQFLVVLDEQLAIRYGAIFVKEITNIINNNKKML